MHMPQNIHKTTQPAALNFYLKTTCVERIHVTVRSSRSLGIFNYAEFSRS